MADRRELGVLLDVDGTLVELSPPQDDLEGLRGQFIALARAHDVAFEHPGIFAIYRRLVDAGGRYGLAAAEARALLDAAEVRWANTTARRLTEGVALSRLIEHGAKVGLVTSNGRACIDALQANGKLDRSFAVIVSRDDCDAIKPAPQPLQLAVRALPGEPSEPVELWFVGDSPLDEAASNAYNSDADTREDAMIRFAHVGPARGHFPAATVDQVLKRLADRPMSRS